jgi:hypothetical protein
MFHSGGKVGDEGLQGGKTWAESPQRMTRPRDHLLQLRAEKVKPLERTTSMQSSGNARSFSRPYLDLGCVKYGNTTFLTFSYLAIS